MFRQYENVYLKKRKPVSFDAYDSYIDKSYEDYMSWEPCFDGEGMVQHLNLKHTSKKPRKLYGYEYEYGSLDDRKMNPKYYKPPVKG